MRGHKISGIFGIIFPPLFLTPFPRFPHQKMKTCRQPFHPDRMANYSGQKSLEGMANYSGQKSLERMANYSGQRSLESMANYSGQRSLESMASYSGQRSLESMANNSGQRSLESMASYCIQDTTFYSTKTNFLLWSKHFC